MYDCRDTARRFFKEEYAKTIEPYTQLIKKVMEANKLDEMRALLKISETSIYQDSGMAQMLFMSATVDLIDPS